MTTEIFVERTSSAAPRYFYQATESLLTSATLARHAAWALAEEAIVTPKPALVDLRGSGAHHDLTVELLLRSARVLEPHFKLMAESAWKQPASIPLREHLGRLGRAAESDMLQATGGINTHRGAIWAVGLLIAAAAQGSTYSAKEICRRAALLAALPDQYAGNGLSHGAAAKLTFGTGGARAEAEAAFPHVVHAGLPALKKARCAGADERCAQLDALLSIMTTLDDTCLLHRGGLIALQTAQKGAHLALAAGGASTAAGCLELKRLHTQLMHLWASPGGSADLLAATLFIDRLQSIEGAAHD